MVEEIVCETVEAYRKACGDAGAFINGWTPKPGETTDGWDVKRVRIVYRPPPVDVEREAFVKWRYGKRVPLYGGPYDEDLLAAFRAGRASASPFDGKRIHAEAWNDAIRSAIRVLETPGPDWSCDRLRKMIVPVPK